MDIYRDAKRRGIYPPLFTDSEGDSCFSIYQIKWIKKKGSSISSSETFTAIFFYIAAFFFCTFNILPMIVSLLTKRTASVFLSQLFCHIIDYKRLFNAEREQ